MAISFFLPENPKQIEGAATCLTPLHKAAKTPSYYIGPFAENHNDDLTRLHRKYLREFASKYKIARELCGINEVTPADELLAQEQYAENLLPPPADISPTADSPATSAEPKKETNDKSKRVFSYAQEAHLAFHLMQLLIIYKNLENKTVSKTAKDSELIDTFLAAMKGENSLLTYSNKQSVKNIFVAKVMQEFIEFVESVRSKLSPEQEINPIFLVEVLEALVAQLNLSYSGDVTRGTTRAVLQTDLWFSNIWNAIQRFSAHWQNLRDKQDALFCNTQLKSWNLLPGEISPMPKGPLQDRFGESEVPILAELRDEYNAAHQGDILMSDFLDKRNTTSSSPQGAKNQTSPDPKARGCCVIL